MPSNDPRQKKQNWREGATPSTKAKPGKHDWRKEADAGATGPIIARRGKILFVTFGLLAVLGGIFAVYLWLRPIDPPRLVLIGAGYETNLAVPHNVQGRRALSDLADWAKEHNKLWGGEKDKGIEVKQSELTSDTDAIAKALDGCTAKTVVVFLAVHGGADTEGAFLLPQDASLKETGSPYRLNKVLAALATLPEKTNKLLILDATQVQVAWGVRIVHNDFARALEKEPRLSTIPNLVVLSSSAADQRSWVSEEYGQSIFAHYVLEGLKGAADLKDADGEGGNTSGDISAKELAEYVQRKTTRWVRHNRGALQTPVLLGSDDIASRMIIVGADENYKPASPRKYEPPAGLAEAWKEYADLEKGLPHPAVYTPQLWHHYQDVLIRYEQLLRAGDTSSAGQLSATLQSLGDRIKQARQVRRDALTSSLGMPIAAGVPLTAAQESALVREFDRLWADTKTDPQDFERKLVGSVTDKDLKPVYRLRACGLLLQKARLSEADFERALDVLPRLDDLIDPRPGEVQYALMLRKALPEKPWNWARIQVALEQREQAEQAALGIDPSGLKAGVTPYSEAVQRWIRQRIEEGDKNRVLGQDLLFTSMKVLNKDADEYLKTAADLYRPAQEEARIIREALRVRDRALSELPFYTRWGARQAFSEDEDREAASLEARKIAAWEKTHRLAVRVEGWSFGKPEELVPLTKAVEDEMKGLAKAFADRSRPEKRPAQQQHWHELDDLLTTPFLAPELRLQMLANLREIGEKLNTDDSSLAGGLTPKQNGDLARAAGLRQGRLAAALLGDDAPEVKDIKSSLDRPGEDEWSKTLRRVGERVAEGFRRIAEEAATNVTEGRKAPPATARNPLGIAALRARWMDGAAVDTWLANLDPIDENRRVQLHDLFVFQAERAWRDYLASEDAAKPHYRIAGGRYLDTARELISGNRSDLPEDQRKGRLADVNRVKEILEAPDGFAMNWRDGDTYRAEKTPLHITDEASLRRIYALQGAAAAPEGFPTVWEKTGPKLLPPVKAERIALSKFSAKPGDAELTFDVRPDRNRAGVDGPREESHQLITGFYRGRLFALESPVVLHHRPDLTSYLPELPAGGKLVVQSEKRVRDRLASTNSHIIFVLDCSGSMDYPNKDGKPRVESRYDRAIKAMTRAVDQLPPGVTVSLFTFSAKEDNGEKSTLRWNRLTWPGAGVNAELAKIRNLQPWHETPLLATMAEARAEFAKDGEKIAKTLVVLTDGADSTFRGPESIPAYLKKHFIGSGIAVTVLGFEVTAAEKQKQGQFEEGVTGIAGRYRDVDDVAELEKELARSLRMRYFLVERSGEFLPGDLPPEGVDLGLIGDNLTPLAIPKPGTFDLHLKRSRLHPKGAEQRLRVERGDALVVELLERDGALLFQRQMYYAADKNTPDANRIKDARPQGPDDAKQWNLGVLQCQRIQNELTRERLEMMVTIEKELGPRRSDQELRVVRPGWVFFSVARADGDSRPVSGLRFYPLVDYPAPAWALEYNAWKDTPKNLWPAPVVSAYWTGEDAQQLPFTPVTRRNDFSDIAVSTETGRTTVVMESVVHEIRRVEVKPGEFREGVDCLVVRLRYPDGKKPFFVQLPPDNPLLRKVRGAEHRFYDEAGKYTGIFWDVSKEDVAQLGSLRLVSVEEVKQSSDNYKVEKLSLPEPRQGPARPKPLSGQNR